MTTQGADRMSSENGRAEQLRETEAEATRIQQEKSELMSTPDRVIAGRIGLPVAANTVGEPLGPEAQKLLPFVTEVIKTSPQDAGRGAPTAGAPRAPEYVGKPVESAASSTSKKA
jgi:hypothetical protein